MRAPLLSTVFQSGRGPALCLLLVGLDLARPAPAHAQVFGANIIINGNAEAGAGSASGNDVVPVPGWTTAGSATVVVYGAPGGFPSATDPGPSDRGVNFFSGGPNGSSSLSQTINVTAGSATINGGAVRYDLSGFLGGFDRQDDNAVLLAVFRDGSGASLGTATIGPVLAADRSNATGLLLQATSGFVPAGTESIDVGLQFTLVSPVYNDGYADNVSLVLTPVPEPLGATLFGAAAVAGLMSRRLRERKATERGTVPTSLAIP